MYRQMRMLGIGLLAVTALSRDKSPEVERVKTTREVMNVMWKEPADIASRDLFYGTGGKQHQPHGRLTFVKEERGGTSPKFTVRDEAGVKWMVKLGPEAGPETAATRIVWAAGYTTDEDYFVKRLRADEMPANLHRGRQFMEADGSFPRVRLEREYDKNWKLENWKWRRNPFEGSRELNALRVLMAVLNNWDLKDVNNLVREVDDAQGGATRVYYVADLGSSFGGAGIVLSMAKSTANADPYRSSRFIRKATPEYVDFEVPKRPPALFLMNPIELVRYLHERWVGTHIPRADARWTGTLLARLSDAQIREAFTAAGYPAAEANEFTRVLRDRIEQLCRL